MPESPLKMWQRVLAVREGGYVQRVHTMPHLSHYNVAQHAWNATALLLLLHPDPSLDLIKHVMFHDVAERWIGDLPYPARKEHAALGAAESSALAAVDQVLDICDSLSVTENYWLDALDMLEFFMWCNDELSLGNQFVRGSRKNAMTAMTQMMRTVPKPVWDIYSEFLVNGRLGYRHSDYLSEMLEKAKNGSSK